MLGSGFRVQGSGCRVEGVGFRVQGLGSRKKHLVLTVVAEIAPLVQWWRGLAITGCPLQGCVNFGLHTSGPCQL